MLDCQGMEWSRCLLQLFAMLQACTLIVVTPCWQVRPSLMNEHGDKEAKRHVEVLKKRLGELEQASLAEKLGKLDQAVNNLAMTVATIKEKQVSLDRVVWTVRDIARVLQLHPEGTILKSGTFQLGRVSDVEMHFYPNGASTAGKYALYLRCPAGWSLSYTMRVGGTSREIASPHDFHKTDTWGFHDFGDVAAIASAAELNVEVSLDSAARLI